MRTLTQEQEKIANKHFAALERDLVEAGKPAYQRFVERTPDYPNCQLAEDSLDSWLANNNVSFPNADDYTVAWIAVKDDVINALNAEAARQFINECPDFYPCDFNGDLLGAHLDTQIGKGRPWTVENLHVAYEFLRDAGLLHRRPAPEPTMADQKLVLRSKAEREAEAAVAAEAEVKRLRKLRNMPLKSLKVLATHERREQISPERQTLIDSGLVQR